MNDLKRRNEQSESCESTAYVPMRVSVPISLSPFIREHPATVTCHGDPKLTPIPNCKRGGCSFILTQCLCVEIPIDIGINTCTGRPWSQCEINSSEDIYKGCRSNRFEDHWTRPNITI